MKNSRKGQNRRDFFRLGLAAGVSLGAGRSAKSQAQQGVDGLAVSPLEVVRIGMIGVGARGSSHLARLLLLEGVEVPAVCDIYEPAAKKMQHYCRKAGRPEPEIYTRGDNDYRRMLERDDLDAVFISTPWRWHTTQAVDSLKAGVHVFVEVPAALTIDECWKLVETAEKTRLHCMMLENVCYGRSELLALHLCRQGLLGELTHAECAYIHDLRFQMKQVARGTGSWRTAHHTHRNGNLYPTHGLGPIAQYMNINRGDRFDRLVSMSSPALGRQRYAEDNFPPDHARNQVRYVCGDMNSSLIQTARGKTILVQHDTTTPRPYTRINLVQGTKGIFRGYPDRVTIEDRDDTHQWADIENYYEQFDHPLWKQVGQKAERAGGHGGMDFLMTWRIINCLREGRALDQDVYDAASWSVVAPLSEDSVAHGGRPIAFPDFTAGRWKKMKPLEIVA